jgi:hypothetical protein
VSTSKAPPQSGFDDATIRKGARASNDDYRIPPSSPWATAWRTAAFVGVLALAASAYGYAMNPERFAFSYMFAFLVFLTISLGSIFFVIIDRLTGSGWSITVRRTAEFLASAIFVFAILFVPIYMVRATLFPWLHMNDTETPAVYPNGTGAEKHSSLDLITPAYAAQPAPPAAMQGPSPTPGMQPHGIQMQPGGPGPNRMHRGAPFNDPGHTPMGMGQLPDRAHMMGMSRGVDPEEALEAKALKEKAPYLNLTFFSIRAVIYFAVWIWLGMRFFRLSTDQDKSKDPKLTLRAQRFAPAAVPLFAFTLTFAAFDWIMSLEPSWFSTIFGVCIFASSVVAMFCTLILLTMALRNDGLLKNAVTVEHYHDMGKFLFGFLVFWAYVNFSQFMLIWYAALPEETTWFHHRWDNGPWKLVSLLLVFMHFIVPFFVLLSRNVKRRLAGLRLGATIIILMHVVEMYWLVMPNYNKGDVAFHYLDLTCLLGIGGVYFAVVLYRMTKFPLIPIGDPRLSRSLGFENS